MSNEREIEVRAELDKLGLLTLRGGWPDFLVYDKERNFTFGVEVKSETHSELKQHQEVIHNILKKAGIPVIVLVVRKMGDDFEWDIDLKGEIQRLYELFN